MAETNNARNWAEVLTNGALADRLTKMHENPRYFSINEKQELLVESAKRLETLDRELARLVKEIKNLQGDIIYGITVRRDHPSYGVTKRSLHKGSGYLTGLIAAHMILTGNANVGNPFVTVDAYALLKMGINLSELTAKVNTSGR